MLGASWCVQEWNGAATLGPMMPETRWEDESEQNKALAVEEKE
jgi:hypothetical protein